MVWSSFAWERADVFGSKTRLRESLSSGTGSGPDFRVVRSAQDRMMLEMEADMPLSNAHLYAEMKKEIKGKGGVAQEADDTCRTRAEHDSAVSLGIGHFWTS